MNQSAGGTLYSTYAGYTCYLFETNVAVVGSGVWEDVRDLTPTEVGEIDRGLLQVMQSVRIAPLGRFRR